MTGRIAAIELDESTLGARSPDVMHERQVAIYDLLESNSFQPKDCPPRPYLLRLSVVDDKLCLSVTAETGGPELHRTLVSLTPFKRAIRDYLHICVSYHDAIRNAPPSRIEAMDMARRAMHNEASELLQARLQESIEIDFDTARRLFTLVVSLHHRGV